MIKLICRKIDIMTNEINKKELPQYKSKSDLERGRRRKLDMLLGIKSEKE